MQRGGFLFAYKYVGTIVGSQWAVGLRRMGKKLKFALLITIEK